MRKRTYAIVGLVVAGLIYLNNASWLARPRSARPTLLAHRGVHQRYDCKDVEADTCTAECMRAPTHRLLENTLSSMQAAFAAGADVVELDVHPTTDGELAVFHDWRLECRTDGSGVTREQSMEYLRTLDLGYGYTADGGKTFPLRGSGVALMPTLTEVLAAFPDHRFLINIKSNDPDEGDLLARFLLSRSEADRGRLMVYGGERPVARVLSVIPELRGLSRASIKSCITRYAVVGWSGYVPSACRKTLLVLPEHRAQYLWGWPHRFIARMESAGTEVFVAGSSTKWVVGIDTAEDFARIAGDNYSGGVWTDRIEVVGPLVARMR